MHGRGSLGSAGFGEYEPFVYVGDFHAGEMQGMGSVAFSSFDGLEWKDHYKGEFDRSLFHGHGVLTMASGERVAGYFENGFCCDGEKVSTTGEAYVGAMQRSLAHGPGVSSPEQRAGFWEESKMVSLLRECGRPLKVFVEETLVQAMGKKTFWAASAGGCVGELHDGGDLCGPGGGWQKARPRSVCERRWFYVQGRVA
mmetsp:Transcript_16506/g.28531  ORF Transcript_16506/g.28531 Transcript_16506/m.28531 type:complete len:198 (-) Transcript_16506:194-787(-)